MKAKRLCLDGIALALALICGYIEHLLPILPALPWVKLGLANSVVLLLMLNGRIADAALVSICRLIITAFTFGSALSFVYAALGALLSFAVMLIISRLKSFSPIGISSAAGVAHNCGQLAAALLLLRTKAVITYLPYLVATGCLCGAAIGLITAAVDRRLKKLRLL